MPTKYVHFTDEQKEQARQESSCQRNTFILLTSRRSRLGKQISVNCSVHREKHSNDPARNMNGRTDRRRSLSAETCGSINTISKAATPLTSSADSMLSMLLIWSNSRIASLRAFSSGVRFLFAIMLNLHNGVFILHHYGGLHNLWDGLIILEYRL